MQIVSDVAPYFMSGTQIVGATPVQLVAGPTSFSRGVAIKADAGNTGTVVVGNNAGLTMGSDSPTTDGFPLKAGESIGLSIADLSRIWLLADTEGQILYFMAD